MYSSSEQRFLRLNYLTVAILYLLILAGGVVRSTGSGMGCPDWPKCFDRYVPPTQASQLPVGYQKKYVGKRIEKNERFAKLMDATGYTELAAEIRNDKSIEEPDEFNAAKTWTEYINRLIGAVCGLFLVGCVLLSVTYIKKSKRIVVLSLLNVFLVAFQAWLGSIVVSTNLLAWVVTVHMLVAIAILAISIYTYHRALVLGNRNILSKTSSKWAKSITYLLLTVTIVQIVLGTEVREEIDSISAAMDNLNRSAWVAEVGLRFNLHRDIALAVLFFSVLLYFIVRKQYLLNGYQFRYGSIVLFLAIVQILTGLVLSYLGLPPIAQAIHILLATLFFGAQFYLLLLLNENKRYSRH